MTADDEFLRAFFSGTLPNAGFHHRDHLRLAWLVVKRDGAEAGEQTVVNGIRHFAAAHGHAERYHDTLTRFWVRLIAHVARASAPADEGFDALLAAHPGLLDVHLPLRHWSRDVLFDPAARAAWCPPDLVPLPF